MIRLVTAILLFVSVAAIAAGGRSEAGRYIDTRDYISGAFASGMPEPQVLWVTGPLREKVEQALGHRFGSLRVRYWFDGVKSVWVLDEIGKELPITIGITVDGGAITNLRVLEFRESRGWEVRYPFFTEQFNNARLVTGGKLDRKIDGITGATLSVGAVKRIAKVALIFHDNVQATG